MEETIELKINKGLSPETWIIIFSFQDLYFIELYLQLAVVKDLSIKIYGNIALWKLIFIKDFSLVLPLSM